MNLREQFENQSDKSAVCYSTMTGSFNDEYVEWLESRLSHPVTEMVTDADRMFTHDDVLIVVDEAFHCYASIFRTAAKEYAEIWMRDRLTQPKQSEK